MDPDQLWRPLGQLLVERGLITEADLAGALAEQQRSGARLGQVLVERRHITTDRLAMVLLEQAGVDVSTQEGFGSGLRDELEKRRAVRAIETRIAPPALAEAEPAPVVEAEVVSIPTPELAVEPELRLEPAPAPAVREAEPAVKRRRSLRRRNPTARLDELVVQFAACADGLERSLGDFHELMRWMGDYAAREASSASGTNGATT
jgi:hypothetical protein